MKGRQVNPLSLKLPTGKKLVGKTYKNFSRQVEKINQIQIVKNM